MAAARGDASDEVRRTMVETSSEPARDEGEPAPAMRVSEWGRGNVDGSPHPRSVGRHGRVTGDLTEARARPADPVLLSLRSIIGEVGDQIHEASSSEYTGTCSSDLCRVLQTAQEAFHGISAAIGDQQDRDRSCELELMWRLFQKWQALWRRASAKRPQDFFAGLLTGPLFTTMAELSSRVYTDDALEWQEKGRQPGVQVLAQIGYSQISRSNLMPDCHFSGGWIEDEQGRRQPHGAGYFTMLQAYIRFIRQHYIAAEWHLDAMFLWLPPRTQARAWLTRRRRHLDGMSARELVLEVMEAFPHHRRRCGAMCCGMSPVAHLGRRMPSSTRPQAGGSRRRQEPPAVQLRTGTGGGQANRAQSPMHSGDGREVGIEHGVPQHVHHHAGTTNYVTANHVHHRAGVTPAEMGQKSAVAPVPATTARHGKVCVAATAQCICARGGARSLRRSGCGSAPKEANEY